MRNVVLPALFAFGLLACGGAEPPPQVPSQPTATPAPKADNAEAAAEARTAPQPSSTIRRSSIRAVLQAGPGAFLQRVTLDDQAVFQGGKFHGFRVQHLNDAAFFRGVDLKPGDVITSINGFAIEHPEEALEAFKSLEVASELKVGYERDGVPRELRYAIVDDEPAPPPAKSAPASPPKR
jgi:type II secretion system protein C